MKNKMTLLVLISLISLALNAQQTCTDPKVCWPFTITDANHTIIIDAATVQPTVNGTPLPVGTYIGVFYETAGALKCAGFTKWTGNSIALAAFGNDGSEPPVGFTQDQALHFKFLLPDGTVIEDVNARYKTPDGALITNTGLYAKDGVTALAAIGSGKISGVGIADNPELVNLTIYPNPNSGSFRLELAVNQKTDIQLLVYNVIGEQVYEKDSKQFKGKYQETIDLPEPAGVYLVKIKIRDSIYFRKVAVQE